MIAAAFGFAVVILIASLPAIVALALFIGARHARKGASR